MPVEARPTKAATPIPAKSSNSDSEPPAGPSSSKSHSNNWEVYPADRMPPGKSLTEAEAAKLTSGDYSEKTMYLVGSFYVAVSQKERAILWPEDKTGPIHIVASFPVSVPPPKEGSRVNREAPRGYRITRIKHPTPEETTIYVREIALP